MFDYDFDEFDFALPRVMAHETYTIDWCPECQTWEVVTDVGSSPGYTGAGIYWTDFACGHQDVDASADNLAAAA